MFNPTITLGQIIDFSNNKFTFPQYVVDDSCGKYYLQNKGGGHNSNILSALGFGTDKKHQFVESIVGYPTDGDFPETKSLEDLEKVINKINEMLNHPELYNLVDVVTFSRYISVACERWQNNIIKEYGTHVLKYGMVRFEMEFVDAMLNDANSSQRQIINKLFQQKRK